jgi:beta-glucanase (GH16 family)
LFWTSEKLVWEENFNGKYLNEKVWNIELGDGCPNCGWGNNERQLYTNENHKIVNGNLVITAKKKEKNTRQHVLRLKLKKNFNMVILKLEQNYQLGMASGLFWMLGSNIDKVGWPKCGEIDILEYVGREPDIILLLYTHRTVMEIQSTQKNKD